MSLSINHVATILVSNTALRAAFQAAHEAAVACNSFTQERAQARSRARTAVMDVLHSALRGLGLELPSSNRTEAEIFVDFIPYCKESFEDFCATVAAAAEEEAEVDTWLACRSGSGHSFMSPQDEHCSLCGDWVGAAPTRTRQPRVLARRAKAAARKDRRLQLAAARLQRADLLCTATYGCASGELRPEYEAAVRRRTPHQIRFRTAVRRAYR
jgi:hypothetical protein